MPTIAIYLIGALALLGTGFAGGYRVEAWHAAAQQQAAVDAAIAEYKAEAVKANEAALDLEKERDEANARNQALSQQVAEIVARPRYRSVCLDPDGLRAANAALAGAAAAPAGADAALPAAPPAR